MRIDEDEKECADLFLLQFSLRISNSNINNNKIRRLKRYNSGKAFTSHT